MTKKRKNPITLEELYQSPYGPPLRLCDVAELSNWSERTVMSDMDRGELVGHKRSDAKNSPWEFQRVDVINYLAIHSRKLSA